MPLNLLRFGQSCQEQAAKWEFPSWTVHPLDDLEARSIRGIKSRLEPPAWGEEVSHWRTLAKDTPATRAQLTDPLGCKGRPPSPSGPARRWLPGPGAPQSHSAGL